MHLLAGCSTSMEDLQQAMGIDSSFRITSLFLLLLSNFLFNVAICNGISNHKIGLFKLGHLVEAQRNICPWLPSSSAVFVGEGENFSLAPSFPSFGSVPEINDLGSPPPFLAPLLRYLFPAAHERTLQRSQERERNRESDLQFGAHHSTSQIIWKPIPRAKAGFSHIISV